MSLEFLQIPVGGFDHNFSYGVRDPETSQTALVDPCGSAEGIRRALCASFPGFIPRYILLTHGHKDHFDALEEVKTFFKAPVAAHPLCKALPSFLPLEDGIRLPLGKSFLRVIHTPGHTPDSLCFLAEDSPKALVSGDTLFVDCCGYCDGKTMFHTLREKIFPLPDETLLYSGHDYGPVPVDTLGNQKRSNPYLAAENIQDFLSALKDL